MKQNVVPIQSHPSTEQLAEMWLDAKRLEMQATEKRIAIEESIIDRVGFREEGSKTTTLDNGVKITTTGKLTYKAADFAALIVELRRAIAVRRSTWPHRRNLRTFIVSGEPTGRNERRRVGFFGTDPFGVRPRGRPCPL